MFSRIFHCPLLWLCTAIAPLQAGLQITEVMLNPADAGGMPDAQYEYIEIYNDGPIAVDIQNWTLETGYAPRTAMTNSPFLIPAGGYVVLGRTTLASFNLANNSAVGAAQYIQLGAWFVPMQDTGEYISIADAGGTQQAMVMVNNGASGWPLLVEGSSVTMRLPQPTAQQIDYQNGLNWMMSREFLVDDNSSQNVGGGYGSPGRGSKLYWVAETWTGAGGDGLWSNPSNWLNNSVPGSSTVVMLTGFAVPTTINITGSRLVRALVINSPQAVTLTGTGSLTIVSGHLNVKGGYQTHTIGIPLTLSGTSPWICTDFPGLNLTSTLAASAGFTKTGSGGLQLGANMTLPSAYSQSLGSTNLAGFSLSAASFYFEGSLASSVPGGLLHTSGNVFLNSSLNITGAPNLTMQPAAGVDVSVIGGQAHNGFKKLEVSGAGRVWPRGFACQELDLVSGGIQLANGPGSLVLRNGPARFRAGTECTGISGTHTLSVQSTTADCPLTNEGCTFGGMGFILDVSVGRKISMGGSADWSNLTAITRTGTGLFQLDGADVTAANLQLSGGTMDLNGRTLATVAGGATTLLSCVLTDSGTGGVLKLATSFSNPGPPGNDGLTLTSAPSLTLAPAAMQSISTGGLPVTGVGRLLIDGPGTVNSIASITCEEFDLKSGTFDLAGNPQAVVVSGGVARLRSGATLRDAFTAGVLKLQGNSQLVYDGSTLSSSP